MLFDHGILPFPDIHISGIDGGAALRGWRTNTALRVAVIYAGFAVVWVVFSDRAVEALARTADEAGELQTLKGVAFVIATSFVVFLLVYREMRERVAAEAGRLEALERQHGLLVKTVEALARIVEKRDPYSAGHQRRASELVEAIGRRLGLPPARIDDLRLGALIYEIGMIGVPAEILTRPGRLNAQEIGIVRLHARAGYEIVRDVGLPEDIGLAILQHHERLDGSGYPEGLKDGAISLGGRIVAVADVVEAMTAHRPYRPALGPDAAVAEIEAGKGSKYDPAVVDACVAALRQDGYAERLGEYH